MSGSSVAERAAGLVEGLFSAPHDPKTWQAFLAAVGEALGERCVVLLLGELVPGGPSVLLGHGVDMSPVRPEDVRPSGIHPPPEEVPVGKAVAIQASDLTFARSRLFQDVLSRRGLAPGPGVYLPLFRNDRHVTGAIIVLSADEDWRLCPDGRALLELLSPYVIAAVQAGLRLHLERLRATALLSAFRRLQLGVVLLDAAEHVTFANDSALETLGLAHLDVPGAELRRRTTAALTPLLRHDADGAAMWTHPHPDDGRPLEVHRTPLRAGDGEAERMRYVTAVFLSDPAASPMAKGSLRSLYGLSPSEARLAELLAGGLSLTEAAVELGIQRSTARSTLRGVFRKTGTHRQTSLVRLILTGPGRVRGVPTGKRGGRSAAR